MRIILIQLKQIGDVLITGSMCKNIKENFPDSIVDILVYEHCEGVLRNNPYIDNIITLSVKERKNPILYYKKILKIRENNYNYVIDLLADMRSGIITFLLNAENRIVSKSNKLRNKMFYNKRIENKNRNTVIRRNYLIKAIDENVKLQNEVKIYINEEEVKTMKERMLENGVNFDKPIAAFGINSRRYYKVWKLEYFIEVIDYLIKEYDFQIILYNNKAERDYALLAKSKIKKKENVFTDINTKDIRELAALLKNCNIFIGNEGGPRHIAESVGTPTFATASITHAEEVWMLNEEKQGKENRMVKPPIDEKMSKEEFEIYRKNLKKDRKKERIEFDRLKPDFVIKEIEKMLKDLNLNSAIKF